MRDVVERAKAALEGITAGPWHIGNCVDPTTRWNVHQYPTCVGVADNVMPLDAEFIAIAPELIAELIAEVECLRGQSSS